MEPAYLWPLLTDLVAVMKNGRSTVTPFADRKRCFFCIIPEKVHPSLDFRLRYDVGKRSIESDGQFGQRFELVNDFDEGLGIEEIAIPRMAR